MEAKSSAPLFFSAAIVIVLFAAVASAEADPYAGFGSDDEILLFQEIPSVYGASKYEQKVTDAPSSVSIVTADEIRKYGYRTLDDILESLRGFVISDDRNYTYAAVRGFGQPGDYNTRLLLLVDGHRMNDALYDAALTGRELPVDVDLIERVEVIRGPSSSLYGSNAFFGVINVVTRSGRDLKGVESAGSSGSFDSKEGRFSYGNNFANGLEVLVSGTYFESDGDDRLYYPEFDDPATNNGVAEDADGHEAKTLFAKLSYGDFTVQGAYSSRDKDIPTASYGTVFNDPRTSTTDEQIFVNLAHEHTFANQIEVRSTLAYRRYDYDGDFVFDYSEDDEPYIVVNQDYSRARWWEGGVQLTVNSFDNHRVVVGSDVQLSTRLDQGNYDEEVYLDDERDATDWGAFVQDEWALRDDLILNAGARYDDPDGFDATVNPRLALIYSPTEKTTFKLLYGTAFRSPNAYELYYHDGGFTTKAAEDLDAETIETTELVWEQSIGTRVRTVVDVFRYEVDDLITLITDPADGLLVFDNTDSAEAYGVELEMEAKWPSGWAGRISYSYQNTENKTTGSTLTNSPNHLAKANLIAPLIPRRLFAGLELQYTDDRKTVYDTQVDAFTVANLTLYAPKIWQGLDVSASVYNVLGENYSDPGSEEHLQDAIEQDERTYRFKVAYAF